MADTIRFGKVSNIDYETGCMEITYEDRGDSVTDKYSFILSLHHSSNKSGTLQKAPLLLFKKVLHFETERIYLY